MTDRFRKGLMALVAASLLAGCQVNIDGTAGGVPLAQSALGFHEQQSWSFGSVEVVVPDSLTVSEANSYKPVSDIVWREDPPGNRREQVDNLMTAALLPVMQRMDGSQPVRIELQVTRFHALTERTRYSFGGQHEIEFYLTVLDARTGAVLRGPRHVDLTFPASGGARAMAEEARGYFQRDAIRDRLQTWALAEFQLADLLVAGL